MIYFYINILYCWDASDMALIMNGWIAFLALTYLLLPQYRDAKEIIVVLAHEILNSYILAFNQQK